MKTCYVGRT